MDPNVIFKYFPNLSITQKGQLQRMGEIYTVWNERLNLISRRDIHQLYLHHVLHSLSIAKIIQFLPDSNIIDVGTGGGFPGIPLAILFPSTKFHLVDTIRKKIYAVQSIAKELGLSNVVTENVRAEQLSGKYDFVLGRAVTDLPVFFRLAGNLISDQNKHQVHNGILYLCGESLKTRAQYTCTIYPIRDLFSESFFETKQIAHMWTL